MKLLVTNIFLLVRNTRIAYRSVTERVFIPSTEGFADVINWLRLRPNSDLENYNVNVQVYDQ